MLNTAIGAHVDPAHSDPVPGKSFTPKLGAVLSEFIARHQIQLACFDLDMSLVDSAPLYIELEIDTCRNFGFHDRSEIISKHVELQALSGDEIMQGLRELGLSRGMRACSFEEFNGYFLALVKQLGQGIFASDAQPQLIPAANHLAQAVIGEGVRSVVTTNAKTLMANFLLSRAGFDSIFPEGNRFRSGDLPFSKSQPEFWPLVRGEIDAARCMGFEDNPTAATWMLDQGFKLVVVRPSKEFRELDAIKGQYGERLLVVNGWEDLIA